MSLLELIIELTAQNKRIEFEQVPFCKDVAFRVNLRWRNEVIMHEVPHEIIYHKEPDDMLCLIIEKMNKDLLQP